MLMKLRAYARDNSSCPGSSAMMLRAVSPHSNVLSLIPFTPQFVSLTFCLLPYIYQSLTHGEKAEHYHKK